MFFVWWLANSLIAGLAPGKSALLANWIFDFEYRHPNVFTVSHFIGSSAESASHYSILRRVMSEIKEKMVSVPLLFFPPPLAYGQQRQRWQSFMEEIPTDMQDLISQFDFWLTRIGHEHLRMVASPLLMCVCVCFLSIPGYY